MIQGRTIRGVGLSIFMRCSTGYFSFVLPCELPSLPLSALCLWSLCQDGLISVGFLAFWFPVVFGYFTSRDERVGGEQGVYLFHISGESGLAAYLLLKTPDLSGVLPPTALLPRLQELLSLCAPSDLGAVVAPCCCQS